MRKIEKKRPRRGRFYFTLLFCRHQLTTNSNFDDSKPNFIVFLPLSALNAQVSELTGNLLHAARVGNLFVQLMAPEIDFSV